MTAVDLDRIAREADADAKQVSRQTPGTSLTKLRRYSLIERLSGHTLRELKDALTLPEMVAERGRLARPLVKNDYVLLLEAKAQRTFLHPTVKAKG